MPAYQRPRFGFRTGFTSGQSGWGLDAGGFNDAMRILDATLHLRVSSFTAVNSPPGSPANGLAVIVGGSPTGAFSGQAGKLAVWDSDAAAWLFVTLVAGITATATDTGHFRAYDGSAFVVPSNIAPTPAYDPIPNNVFSAVAGNTPPGSPVNGRVYVVGASPTGAWSGQANKLARWSSGTSSYTFYAIPEGHPVLDNSDAFFVWDGAEFTVPPNIEPITPPDPIYPTPSRVASFTATNTPPGSPADGDVYLVGSSPTGAWAGQAGKLARWEAANSAYRFFTLVFGDEVVAEDTGHFRTYNGTTFVVPPNITPADAYDPVPNGVFSITPANTPPGSPVDGRVYLTGSSPTGAWSGQANKLARWSAGGSAYTFFVIPLGHPVTDDGENFYAWDGTAFVLPTNLTPPAAFVPIPERVETISAQTTPPGSPASGDTYFLAASPTGAWSGQGGKLASWNGSTWAFFTLTNGDQVRAKDTGNFFVWDGSAFVVPPNITPADAYDPVPSMVFSITAGNTPPGSPVDGRVYLIGASPTGAWSGQANKLARYSSGTSSYTFFAIPLGHPISDDGENFYVWDGSAFVLPANLTPPSAFDPDTLIPRELVTMTPQNSAPGSPSENDAYFVSASPSGAFTGQASKLAKYVNAAWLFFSQPVGHAVVAQDTRNLTVWNGSAWVAPPNLVYTPPTRKVRVAFSLEGTLTNGMVLARVPFDLAVEFATTPTGSRADAKTAATSSTTITIVKEEAGGTRTNVGTIVWSASGTLATISFSSTTNFAAGDLIEFLGPVTGDPTLADIGFLIVGTEA